MGFIHYTGTRWRTQRFDVSMFIRKHFHRKHSLLMAARSGQRLSRRSRVHEASFKQASLSCQNLKPKIFRGLPLPLEDNLATLPEWCSIRLFGTLRKARLALQPRYQIKGRAHCLIFKSNPFPLQEIHKHRHCHQNNPSQLHGLSLSCQPSGTGSLICSFSVLPVCEKMTHLLFPSCCSSFCFHDKHSSVFLPGPCR